MFIVTCPSLDDPNDGRIECSVEPDDVPTEGDTCIYVCNDGFDINGELTRECQSDGTWTGTDSTCERGRIIFPPYTINYVTRKF